MAPEVLIDSLENISYKLYKRHQAVRKKPEGVRQWSCLLFLLSSYRFAVIRFVANSGYCDEIGDQSAFTKQAMSRHSDLFLGKEATT